MRLALRRLAVRLRQRTRDLPPVAWLAEVTRPRRARARLRATGWFDAAWYREQAGPSLAPGADPIAHYLQVGVHRGWQPHPLFDPKYYLDHSPLARRSATEPFTEFIIRGARRGDDPHPLFDTASYRSQAPEATKHPRGPFGHYLELGWQRGIWPVAELAGGDVPTGNTGTDRYLDLVRRVQRAHAADAGHADLERFRPTFDHDAAAMFVAQMRAHAARTKNGPLISVILPTRDRADVLPVAVESVLAQTHRKLEVLVVDDGSTDATAQVVAEHPDPRVRYLRQKPAGVSAARNQGLAAARGELVAYLDSDNTWVPEYLEVMAAFLQVAGHRAAYAGVELRTDDGASYLGRQVHLAALRERNYIDLNALVHERALVDEVGDFDEELRRVVDWDLLLRLAEVTELGYAPFVGVHYDASHDRGDRLTTRESPGYSQVVRHRYLVDLATAPSIVAGRTSIVLVALPGMTDVAATARAWLEVGRAPVEIVIVDVGCAWKPALRLRALALAREDVMLERAVGGMVSEPVAIDLAASRASGDVLVHVDAAVPPAPGDLDELARIVRHGDAELVQPTLLTAPDGPVLSTGRRLLLRPSSEDASEGGDPGQHGVARGDGEGAGSAELELDGVAGHVFAVDTAWFRRLGGLDPLFVYGGADLDLGLRFAAAGGRVRWVPQVGLVVAGPDAQRRWRPDGFDARELRRKHTSRLRGWALEDGR